jgi:hypothetical protein
MVAIWLVVSDKLCHLKDFSNQIAPNHIIFLNRDNFPPIFRKGSNTSDVSVSDGTIVCQDDETYQTRQTRLQL